MHIQTFLIVCFGQTTISREHKEVLEYAILFVCASFTSKSYFGLCQMNFKGIPNKH